MNLEKQWRQIVHSPRNVRFADLVRVLERIGFTLERVTGSHHIFEYPGVPEHVNIQSDNGMAKPYQVRQVIKLVERYNMLKDHL